MSTSSSSLGVAAAVTMFSVLNAVVLRELPYGRPQELMWRWSMRPGGGRGPFSIQDFIDLRERETGCESLGAFANWSANLTGLGTAERLQACARRPTPSRCSRWPRPGPYAVVTMIVVLVAACACYLPAARAGRSDPLRVIRNQ